MSAARADEIAVVAVGGVVGALARASISSVVPHHDSAAWPWATFVTNLLGCLVLGIVLDWVDNRHTAWKAVHPRRSRLMRPFLASGVLGGFTTFSAFAVDAVRLTDAGSGAVAAGYVVATVAVGLVAVRLGAQATRALTGGARVPEPLPVPDEEA